jgi:hypothetical protein
MTDMPPLTQPASFLLKHFAKKLMRNVFYPELKRFEDVINFDIRDHRKISIVVAETVAPEDISSSTTNKGIRASGEGQVYALFDLMPLLGRVFGYEKLEIEFANKKNSLTKEQFDAKTENTRMIILGGPLHNNWAEAAMKYYQPQYMYGCLLNNKQDTTKYDPNTLYDGDTAFIHGKDIDFGLLIPIKEDHNNFNRCFVLTGNTTKGTHAAARCLKDKKTLDQIIHNYKVKNTRELCCCVRSEHFDQSTIGTSKHLFFGNMKHIR